MVTENALVSQVFSSDQHFTMDDCTCSMRLDEINQQSQRQNASNDFA
jgi:hypothetical protein